MVDRLADSSWNILLVEDEVEIRELMALHLLRQGYRIVEAGSAEKALEEIAKGSFHLYVLDWMLPQMSGVDFAAVLRQREPQASILMVTAKSEPQDIIEGLEKGADDYVIKPFDSTIFLARVKALLRRASHVSNFAQQNIKEITLWDLYVNLETYEVKHGEEALHLTPSEYKLLVTMMQSQGKVLTREKLIEQIQGEGVNVVGRTVDTHIFGLRKKLGNWGEHIETIRGVGYRVKLEE